MFLHVSEEVAKKHGVALTKKEILQQPRLWQEAYDYINENTKTIKQFFEDILERHQQVKVIFAGAGTSAFIGECITPFLNKQNKLINLIITHVATTDIVSNPMYYLDAEMPTIMVSFARSGSSPESVASVELGEQMIHDFYKLHITCNPDGHLAKKYKNDPHSLLLLMPNGSNDKGFAMTSSYSSMMLSSLLVFQLSEMSALHSYVQTIADYCQRIQDTYEDQINQIVSRPISNIVYLGSGPLLGLAHEASLKMLELTDGNVFTSFDSPLGFRHGPKAILQENSLVVMFLSSDPYTRKYDVDMLKELAQERKSTRFEILVITEDLNQELTSYSDYYISLQTQTDTKMLPDVYLAFPYIFSCQILAVSKSLQLGYTPDSPSTSGSVNRVVQGVTIHPLEQA